MLQTRSISTLTEKRQRKDNEGLFHARSTRLTVAVSHAILTTPLFMAMLMGGMRESENDHPRSAVHSNFRDSASGDGLVVVVVVVAAEPRLKLAASYTRSRIVLHVLGLDGQPQVFGGRSGSLPEGQYPARHGPC